MAKKIANPNQLQIDFDAILQDLFLMGDVHNISKMLPTLYVSQHEDVARAEKRFEQGKGYLFTNGTGTGKTFVGLGVAYRFWKKGCKHILIIVPTDAKAEDWIDDGKKVGLSIYKLKDTQDCGSHSEIVITTYANFYDNNELNKRPWGLIEYDESHKLNQNERGVKTVYQQKHRHIAKLPSAAKVIAYEIVGKKPDTLCHDTILKYKENYWNTVKEIVGSTKVLYLSATPFAYHKSIEYGDGTLWDINETLEGSNDYQGYNEPDRFQQFMISNFGYQMKTNKLNIPDSGVDQDLMERQFFEKHVEMGVMSTRQLDLPYDYSRQFITLDSQIGKFIDEGMNEFHKPEFKKKYEILSEMFSRKYNYNYVNQLLETVKAQNIHTRIQQHLDLKRKVVVFHGYNHSVIEHPFRFSTNILTKEESWNKERTLQEEINKYKAEYPQYWNMDLSSLKNTREVILSHFPWARQFNGTITNKKLRNSFLKEFNNDKGGMDLILVQEAAGREGISMHDKTGVKQRVLMNLGLPVAPTSAIQIEGRIYREGLKSNAVYEYITLQTSSEQYAFGTKIAMRAKTAENLAMGNLARDLETSFKEGYVNSTYELPNLEQGTGGKEMDKSLKTISEYDAAKTYYFSRGKRNASNKSREGKDYFATPEPLGYKMVEWLNPKPKEDGIEPSAGHGAIARYFPKFCENTFVEPSHELQAQLSISISSGNIRQCTFEELSIINKADFIAMNPPFGVGSKTAMQHLERALTKHLRAKGRLICIVPRGASMDKRLDEFLNSQAGQRVNLTGEILLPACTFERAGTMVQCKVLRFDNVMAPSRNYIKHDLSYIKTTEEFFNVLEHLNF